MSILLDALKKAEARKRLEAAQEGEPAAAGSSAPVPAAPSASGGLSLEPMTEATPPTAAVEGTPETPTVSPASSATMPTLELAPVDTRVPEPGRTNDSPLSLEALPPNTATETISTTPVADATAPHIETKTPAFATQGEVARGGDAHTTASAGTSASASITASPAAAMATTPSAPGTPAPSVDTSASRPAAPAFRAAEEVSSAPTAGTPPAATRSGGSPATNDKVAPDTRAPAAGDNDAARRQAQTVLSAPRAKADAGSRSRWIYVSAGVGLLVLLGGGAVFLRQLGVPPFGAPASLVANVPPTSSEPVAASAAEAPPPATEADNVSAIETGSDTALASANDGESAPAPAIASPATPATASVAPRIEPAPSAAPADDGETAFADTPTRPAPPARSPLSTPVDELQLRREPLRVQRRSAPSQLNAAYAALQAGQLDSAEAAYRSALDAQPGELDALLGLAVIAERRGDRANAERYYRRVLAQQPDHPQAMAALLSANGPPQGDDEQRLRQSLAEHPESAVLHAAMGQRMAMQQRWADAQAAYFEAVAREPGNADHLYNLAVALDHLRQPRVAADYYRRALAQPDPGSRFDREAAMQRLAALDAAGASR